MKDVGNIVEVLIIDEQSTKKKASSLVDRLKEVSTPTSSEFMLSQVKKKKDEHKKEKKKKNKKEKKKQKISDGLEVYTSEGLVDVDEAAEIKKEKDEFDLLLEDSFIDIMEDDVDDEDIIRSERNKYNSRKKDENPYKKEFNEEITLLYGMLDEINRLAKGVEKQYKAIESSKVRGVSKYSNDLLSNLANLKTNKLQIIKEIAAIKKVVADLGIKSDKSSGKGGEGSSLNTEQMMSSYLNNIMSGGRKNFLDALSGGGSGGSPVNTGVIEEDEFDTLMGEGNPSMTGELQFEEEEDKTAEDFQRIIQSRLEEEGNSLRDEEGTQYIQFENMGVSVVINRSLDTGDWEFVAIDRNGEEVEEYPLPDRTKIGKMTFRDEYAKDARGRTYKVYDYEEDDD